MTLQDLLTQLAVGDLSNTSFAENGAIKATQLDKVVLAIQDGLTQLHTRFTLSFMDVWVETHKHITYYHLDPLYAESSADESSAKILYIKDLFGERFTGGVIKILNVFNEYDEELPLNDSESITSFFTPQPTILQLPRVWDGGLVNVVYQANHAKLKSSETNQRVQLPEALVAALCSYVNYRLQSPINTAEAMNKALESKNNYESLCQSALLNGIVNSDVGTSNTKFERNGWV